jgi:GNAT superfamily N-acetyltransferase
VYSFEIEPWAKIAAEGQAIFAEHFDELATHKDVMPMGLDHDFYADLEKRGYLLVIAARRNGELIGYYVGIVIAHHPHNKAGGKVATTDMFYIAKAHRKGGAGAKLLLTAERELKRNGVVVATLSTKIHMESGKLLDALGWEKTDIVRKKVL